MEKDIISYLMNDLNCSEEVAVDTLKKLSEFEDIFAEFNYWFTNRKFIDADKAVKVEGFTAEELYNKFEILEVGAFNLLASLRMEKDATVDYIKNGLPLH